MRNDCYPVDTVTIQQLRAWSLQPNPTESSQDKESAIAQEEQLRPQENAAEEVGRPTESEEIPPVSS